MDNEKEIKLTTLAARSETPARTIRLYISMGLLPGPLRPGRNAAYGPEHLEGLKRIRALQRAGLTLSQVRTALAPEKTCEIPEPSSGLWRQYWLAPDVQVSIREDIAPWRTHALRQALQQFNRLVNAAEQTKEQEDEE